MESQPPQNSETAIAEKSVDRNEKEADEEGNFFSSDELEEYKKVHEVLLKFLTAKPKNKSDLRKSLFNIIASSTRRLAFLEDATNQETIGTRTQHTKSNQQINSDEYEKFSNPEDEIILRKIKGHLGQKKDEKNEKIPRVTIQRISCYNKPTDPVLYKNDNCRMNNKTSDTTSSQYIPVLQENASQTIMKKEEIDDTQLNKEIQIEIECKNVKPSIISFILEESNISIKCQPNRQNEKISPLKSIHSSGKSKKFKACPVWEDK
ncbi:uncharacterized protein LOC106657566 [Trichogramma pretiosum]|uniref:uncharacterized protein LOC106657566 n=1 Tax=Trichogramma pretiosum TaxID=7493 RepID=UPI0006C95B3E|nr:uncharacterized protein LOC106657566 [Trichogramma pretiosum]XP_023317896.1 uncharacterized protein LOC106657566 [Trichogramma pretiosum]XP_023317902.1 uncharacterized protein LOC106657566 [Trichogramma pretiosum]